MAVVMEMKARNGVKIRFVDDAYAGCSEEELLRRQRKAAREITAIIVEQLEKLPPEERPAFITRVTAPENALPPGVWLG